MPSECPDMRDLFLHLCPADFCLHNLIKNHYFGIVLDSFRKNIFQIGFGFFSNSDSDSSSDPSSDSNSDSCLDSGFHCKTNRIMTFPGSGYGSGSNSDSCSCLDPSSDFGSIWILIRVCICIRTGIRIQIFITKRSKTIGVCMFFDSSLFNPDLKSALSRSKLKKAFVFFGVFVFFSDLI